MEMFLSYLNSMACVYIQNRRKDLIITDKGSVLFPKRDNYSTLKPYIWGCAISIFLIILIKKSLYIYKGIVINNISSFIIILN